MNTSTGIFAFAFALSVAVRPAVAQEAIQDWVRRDRLPGSTLGPAGIALDAAGDAFVTGDSSRGKASRCYTAKYAGADGKVVWRRSYQGPGDTSVRAFGIAADRAGDVFITGSSSTVGGDSDAFTVKYSGIDGKLLWQRRHDGYQAGLSIVLDRRGDVIVAGGYEPVFMVKYRGADGALTWERRGSTTIAKITVDRGGNIAVTGGLPGVRSGRDMYIARYTGDTGTLLWDQRHSYPIRDSSDQGESVATDRAGNVIVSGTELQGRTDYLAKYAAKDGALLWEKRRPGSGSPAYFVPYETNVSVDQVDNVIFTAYDFTAKYDPDGNLVWEKH